LTASYTLSPSTPHCLYFSDWLLGLMAIVQSTDTCSVGFGHTSRQFRRFAEAKKHLRRKRTGVVGSRCGWRVHSYLHSRGGEPEHEDLGADVAGDAELDAVVDRGVADEVLRVGLEHVEAVDNDAGLEQAGAVRGLLEPGHRRHPERHPVVHDVERRGAVPDAHLVGVLGGEEQRDVEGEVGGAGGHAGRGRRRRGHQEVLHGHLVEVELRFAGLHHEHDDERDGQSEERQEGEQQEEAAAAAAEGGGPPAVPVVRAALRVPGPRAASVAVGSGRHGPGRRPRDRREGWEGTALDFWSLLGHLRGAMVEVRDWAEAEGKVWRGQVRWGRWACEVGACTWGRFSFFPLFLRTPFLFRLGTGISGVQIALFGLWSRGVGRRITRRPPASRILR
jgi:hypothetical protein